MGIGDDFAEMDLASLSSGAAAGGASGSPTMSAMAVDVAEETCELIESMKYLLGVLKPSSMH